MSENFSSYECKDHFRAVIQPENTGAFLFLFVLPDSALPEFDYWFDTVQDAKQAAQEDYGVSINSWNATSDRF